MPYLIFGADTFRSRAKLNAIKQKYIDASLGDTNLAVLDGATAKPDEIVRQIWAMPFLAPKRLVIIENLLLEGKKDAQEVIAEFLPKIPSTSVVIFYEKGIPDKRTSLFKHLNKPKFSDEYPPLENIKLRQWMGRQLSSLQTSAEPDAVITLMEIIGPDLWRMEQEITKLALHSQDKITAQDVHLLVHKEPVGDIFQLIDALISGNALGAISHLKARLALGDSPIYLLSMIVFGFRNLLIVQDTLNRQSNYRSPDSLAKQVGIHPYVFKKSAAQAKRFSEDQLYAAYHYLRDLDYAIKTGIIESEVALDLFVYEFCGKGIEEGKHGYLAAHQRAG